MEKWLISSFPLVCGGALFLLSACGRHVAPDPPLAEPVYSEQSLGVAKPCALEFWIQSPHRYKDYPWNILRMWFPEQAGIRDMNGKKLWNLHMISDPAVWERAEGGLRAECDIPGGGKFIRTVKSEGAVINFVMSFQNDSKNPWRNANGGSCLQFSAAADYEDNTGERTYWVLDGVLTPTFHTAITDPGMRGHCSVGQKIPMKDGTQKTVSEGAVFIPSKDGKYVLGYSWQPAAGMFYNRAGIVACNHVHPPGFDVAPGETKTANGIIFVHEGSKEEAYQRFLDWKSGLNDG